MTPLALVGLLGCSTRNLSEELQGSKAQADRDGADREVRL
jgi:hypothetical protein